MSIFARKIVEVGRTTVTQRPMSIAVDAAGAVWCMTEVSKVMGGLGSILLLEDVRNSRWAEVSRHQCENAMVSRFGDGRQAVVSGEASESIVVFPYGPGALPPNEELSLALDFESPACEDEITHRIWRDMCELIDTEDCRVKIRDTGGDGLIVAEVESMGGSCYTVLARWGAGEVSLLHCLSGHEEVIITGADSFVGVNRGCLWSYKAQTNTLTRVHWDRPEPVAHMPWNDHRIDSALVRRRWALLDGSVPILAKCGCANYPRELIDEVGLSGEARVDEIHRRSAEYRGRITWLVGSLDSRSLEPDPPTRVVQPAETSWHGSENHLWCLSAGQLQVLDRGSLQTIGTTEVEGRTSYCVRMTQSVAVTDDLFVCARESAQSASQFDLITYCLS